MTKLLLDAATDGKLAALKKCIEEGVDVNGRGRAYTSVCMVHTRRHTVLCTQSLLCRLCKDNSPWQSCVHASVALLQETTALMCAATKGYVDIAEELLCAGADPAFKDYVSSKPSI